MAISLIIGRISERMSWKQSEEDPAADQLTPFKLGGGRLCSHINACPSKFKKLPTPLVFFSQKVLMHSSLLQTDEPNYFPELEF